MLFSFILQNDIKMIFLVFCPCRVGVAAASHAHHRDILLLVLLRCAPGSLSDKIQIITIIGNCIKAMTEIYNAINVGQIIPCSVDVAEFSQSFLRVFSEI